MRGREKIVREAGGKSGECDVRKPKEEHFKKKGVMVSNVHKAPENES